MCMHHVCVHKGAERVGGSGAPCEIMSRLILVEFWKPYSCALHAWCPTLKQPSWKEPLTILQSPVASQHPHIPCSTSWNLETARQTLHTCGREGKVGGGRERYQLASLDLSLIHI